MLDHAGVTLSPLILQGLAAGRTGISVPAEVSHRLRANAGVLVAGHLRRQAALRKILAALADASIPVIVLKGAALAYLVYEVPTLRPMIDLDLWVPPDEMGRAVSILAELHFLEDRELAQSLPAYLPANQLHERTLTSASEQVIVELHGVLPSLEGVTWAPFARAWQFTEPVSLAGIPARVLSPEPQLAHLCLHLGRKNVFSGRLLSLVDIALATARWSERLDWERQRRAWDAEGTTLWMLLALTLARDLLHAPVSADLERMGSLPDDWPVMREIAIRRLWEGRDNPLPPLLGLAVTGHLGGYLRQRFVDHYWRSTAHRGPLAASRDAAARFWYDLRVRVPLYIRAWRMGVLHGPHRARAAAIERDRNELSRLVQAGGGIACSPVTKGIHHTIAEGAAPR